MCHPLQSDGFAPGHNFGTRSCTPCHRGDGQTDNETDAHRGMLAFPGNPDNADFACGGCHPSQVSGVRNGFMNTGKGIVAITRQVFGDEPQHEPSFASLGHWPADSLMRKLCASCHLGHNRTAHRLGSPRRGGGCLACHINAYPRTAHPGLTTKIKDRRCFGCHSRSARVSLNYYGLAEADRPAGPDAGASNLLRLNDGRLVERKDADVHQKAGMSCIDCHTGPGLMGSAEGLRYAREAVDIQCADCHRSARAPIRLKDWPQEYAGYKARLSFPADAEQPFLRTERKGTPLWNLEVEGERLWLHRKLSGGRIEIPQYRSSSHPLEEDHIRLSCEACHSRWAPQCYGCHLEYVPDEQQWDHRLGRLTPGRWREYRWGVESAEPILGVTADGRIHPFVPGMILMIEHPRWKQPRFHRLFAATSPHTTGKARDCESCHRSPRTLGLGAGRLFRCADGWHFEPRRPALQDGLPADAWTALPGNQVGASIREDDRSLSNQEILRVLDARLTAEAPADGAARSLDEVACRRTPR